MQRDIWGTVSRYVPADYTQHYHYLDTEALGLDAPAGTYAGTAWSGMYRQPFPLERDGVPVTGQPDDIRIVGQWEHRRGYAVTGHEMVTCHNCGGTRTYDYGSKQRPVIFEDGIKVNSAGEVVNPELYARLFPTDAEVKARAEAQAKAEVKANRAAKRARRAEVAAWIREHGLTVSADGKTVRMWKSVHEDYRSGYGFAYRPGTTVTAPDYRPYGDCGGGLHFAPTVTGGRKFLRSGEATPARFLACDVDIASMVPSYGKAKARTCRVAFEVREDGTPV